VLFRSPNFTASLDDARVEGRFRVTGLEKKTYTFNLRISGLDADRFLPTKKAETPAPEPAKAAPGAEAPKDEVFPVKTLREMKLDGQITAERFKIRGLRFASLKAPMMAQDGVLDIAPVEARLYDGTLKSSTRLDVQGERPVLTQSFSVVGVQAKPLFSDLKGRESGFAGVMQVETLSPLVCQGNSEFALKRSMSGRVHFLVRDGVFPGVNLTGVVTDAAGKVKRAATGEHTGAEHSTKFGSIEGTAVIQNGVAAINDLEFKAPFLRAEGKGNVDIATKQVDYTIRAKLAATTEGQGGTSAKDALGLVVPVRVTGPYDNLSYSTDILRALGKGAIDAVGGVVQGIGEVITGKKSGGKRSGGLLDGVKKLF
jgi:AsmA protein